MIILLIYLFATDYTDFTDYITKKFRVVRGYNYDVHVDRGYNYDARAVCGY